MATAKKPAKKGPIKKAAKRTVAKRAMAPDLARKVAAAAEAAGSERLTAVEHAADRLGRYLREHRNTLKSVTPLLIAGSEKAPQLILESDLSFRVRSIDERKRSSMDRASTAEVVELWAAADLYDRLEAALRRAAGLSSRPTGAIIAGLGVAGTTAQRFNRAMGAPPVTAQLLAVGELSPGRNTLLLRVPELIATLRPGHALHLVHAEAGGYRLRRVAPVTKIDLLAGSVEVALLPRADGGRDSLAELTAGAQIAVVGPIGQPIEIDSASQQLLIVTDGEGFAWVRLLAASLISAGRSVVLLVEARTAAELPAASLLPEQVEIVVATEDGSLGHQGSAADLMSTYAGWADQVIASGERGLLNAVTSAARAASAIDRTTAKGKRRSRQAGGAPWLQLLISHEIGCGSGVCGGCTFSSANGSVRLCREGPAVSAPGLSAGTRRDS